MPKNRIIPQMFDVRPVDKTGDLDWEKIRSIGKSEFEMESARREEIALKQQEQREQLVRAQALEHQEELKRIVEHNRAHQEAYQSFIMAERERDEKERAILAEMEMRNKAWECSEKEKKLKKTARAKKWKKFKRRLFGEKKIGEGFSWDDVFSPPQFSFQFDVNSSLKMFAITALMILFGVGGVAYASKGLGIKGRVLGVSTDGYENFNSAIKDVADQNFESSDKKFSEAYANFSEGSKELESMGGLLVDATRFIPFATKLSSGKNAIEAGRHFAVAGKALNEVAKISAELKNPTANQGRSETSLLDVLASAEKNIAIAKKEMDEAQQNMDKISIDDLPEDKRGKFLLLKQQLPDLRNAMEFFLNNSQIISDLLGANGPRKYLFLFQNNSEMRATGGFIGTYGLLDISNGHVRKFFIDGIFNPDGQLREKIIPPFPVQKISANWSMHDSNWFADFPASARKAIQFYEKTGGPTADGVITLTPTVMQKLLEITGSIDMPEYEVTLDSNNFVELTQNEVEVEYDKQDNRPKKILSDLAPLVLEKLLSSKDAQTISRTMSALLDGLKEKHILLYSENAQLEKMISGQGWSGELLSSNKDYLSVINSNINGYKTDAVMEESINHEAEIQTDGSIVDTVTITRKHNGGNSQYEWFNKVNANYMRVYVPKGSKLLDVSGQTREAVKAPLDYDALGFKRDADVQHLEGSMTIHEESGTNVFEEGDKTVFANWTYVSPGESATIKYEYLLPFKLFQVSVQNRQQSDAYSLVAQKQSGSVGSAFVSNVSYPENYEVGWNFPDNMERSENNANMESKLDTDRFMGILFTKK